MTFQILFLHGTFTNSFFNFFIFTFTSNDLSLASGWLQVRNRDMDLLRDDSSIDLIDDIYDVMIYIIFGYE